MIKLFFFFSILKEGISCLINLFRCMLFLACLYLLVSYRLIWPSCLYKSGLWSAREVGWDTTLLH